jgi:hypothetical protein
MKRIFTILTMLLTTSLFAQNTNVALNQSYYASIGTMASTNNHNPTFAFDGHDTTAWHPQASATQWISVVFNGTMIIDSLTFWYGQNPAGSTTQEIYTTNDGVNWTLAETIQPYHQLVSVGQSPNYTHIFSTAIQGSMGIKINTTVNPSWIQWREIRVWGRSTCATLTNDTSHYLVDDAVFMNISPVTYLDSSRILQTIINGCDSVVDYYSNFIYSATYCTDTTFITVNDTVLVSVEDTLNIDVALSLPAPNNVNTILVYPNPAKTNITIDNGNYANMSGYSITITNTISQVMFTGLINQQTFDVDISSWSGGTYFVNIIDSGGLTVDTRQIVKF